MTSIGGNSRAQIKSIVDRIENLETERQQIANGIRDVYAEAKGNGFDVKALRAIVRRRKQDAAELAEHEALVETYMHALGMLADLPLGQAAAARDLPPVAKLVDVDTSHPPFMSDEPRVAEPDIPPFLQRA